MANFHKKGQSNFTFTKSIFTFTKSHFDVNICQLSSQFTGFGFKQNCTVECNLAVAFPISNLLTIAKFVAACFVM